MLMKKILLLLLAALPLVFGSCSSDGEEINGTSNGIDVTIKFSNDTENVKHLVDYSVHLISIGDATIQSVSYENPYERYYINIRKSNGETETRYSDWYGKCMQEFDSNKNRLPVLSAHCYKNFALSSDVFPYGKCLVILNYNYRGFTTDGVYYYKVATLTGSNVLDLDLTDGTWTEVMK